jgi:hypothetical protein
MHKKRLLKLADLVEQSVEKSHGRKGFQFDMNYWGYVDDGKKPEFSCGTSACMMGVAALSGQFARQGLRYRVEETWLAREIRLSMKSGTSGGIEVGEELFDLTNEESQFLFYPEKWPEHAPRSGKRGARYAAKRVRKFVEHGGIF